MGKVRCRQICSLQKHAMCFVHMALSIPYFIELFASMSEMGMQ